MHYLIFVGIIGLGTMLRFWNLTAKPMWMDEVITALFSLGRNYLEVPLEQGFAVSDLDSLFHWVPTTCAGIAQTISVQSVHPPLFFCWLHHWVALVQPLQQSWLWNLRSLSAAAGVGAIAALYLLNRSAFGKTAGLVGALTMAISPFAIYLSQEARHYTIPMVLMGMALLGLVRIQQDLQEQRLRIRSWLGWVIANGLGFYVHYFFVLAVVAQVLTLIALQVRREMLRRNVQHRLRLEGMDEPQAVIRLSRRSWVAIARSILAVGLCYLPGLPIFFTHMSRPETDWLATGQNGWLSWIAPLYQMVAGWMVMAIVLPIEQQPWWVIIPCAIVMLVGWGCLSWIVTKGLRTLLADPKTHWETLTLLSFVLWNLLAFFAIVYLLRKDITQVPRYNFIYFPAVCALVGASLWAAGSSFKFDLRNFKFLQSFAFFTVSLISCCCVVLNLAFLKPYLPDQVASTILNPSNRALTVMAYEDFQDIALGLSFAAALRQQNGQATAFAFLGRQQGYEQVWQKLTQLQPSDSLWIIAPGLRRTDFPTSLSIGAAKCQAEPEQYHRIGIPYQGYECKHL